MMFYDYPMLDDPGFLPVNLDKREFFQNRQPDVDPSEFTPEERERIIQESCDPKEFLLLPHQRFVGEYMRPRTPYMSFLLFHGLGTGKTASALTIAERFKDYVTERGTKIFVLGNKTSRAAFENELFGQAVGNVYLAEDDRGDPKTERLARRDIRKYYEFLGYTAFANHVFRRSERGSLSSMSPAIKKLREENVSNALIIIDEAHNVIPKGTAKSKLVFDALTKVLSKSQNTRLLLLTGTPVFDNPTEIVYLLYMLLLNDKKTTLDELPQIENLANNLFEKDNTNQLTTEGLAFLQRSKGYVSYVKGFNPFTFPERVDRGRPIAGILSNLKVYRCWMSPYQVKGYIQALIEDRKSDNWGLKQKAQYASLIVYPDGTYGSEGFRKYKNDLSFLKETELPKYSCKLARLLQFIKSAPGPVFVHSVYVNENGIAVIRRMLNANGFRRQYAVIKGQTTSAEAERIRTRFSSKENADGSLLKILIGSQAVGEGMNLRNVTRVFIMEPHFNVSRIEQAIGRAIRHCSHVDLPPSKRRVEVFRFVASVRKRDRKPLKDAFEDDKDDNSIMANRTVDELMYKIAEDKLEQSRVIETLLRDNALDYQLKTHQIDIEQDLDESTYDFARSTLLLAQVKAFVKSLFTRNTVWSLNDMVNETLKHFDNNVDKNPLLRDELVQMVKWALEIIITDKETVQNRFGRQGYVIYRGRFYIFNLFGMSENASLSQRDLEPPTLITKGDISSFLNNDPRFARPEDEHKKKRRQKSIKAFDSKQTQAALEAIREKLTAEGVDPEDQVVGCYKTTGNGKKQFSILFPSKETGSFVTTGTVCTKGGKKLQLHDLIVLAQRLGIGTVLDLDEPIRFEFELLQHPTTRKWSLKRPKGQTRYQGKTAKEYVCSLIQRKLEATDRMIGECPKIRKRRR